MAAVEDLASMGYVEEEYFISGEATGFALSGEATADGRWSVASASTAPYATRLLVRRPSDPDDFSGTVVVEWPVVSTGREFDVDWAYTSEELMREGHAWVGASAQAVGVAGGLTTGAELPGGLAGSDPERYGSLRHPGDAYAFDIFTQAGAALLNPDGPAPLGDLEPVRLIATGISQSAGFLTTYVNAIQPIADLYDGFLLHARGGGAWQLTGIPYEEPVQIRTDGRAPVLMFLTEFDVPWPAGAGFHFARQDDTATVRTWEVAGAGHLDDYIAEYYDLDANPEVSSIVDCDGPAFNDGPHREVLQAALHHLVAWVDGGSPPPESPRLALVEGQTTVIERDARGIAVGGLRTPPVDVPVATLNGEPRMLGTGPFCAVFGTTIPFDAPTLHALYRTQADYVRAFTAAADAAVGAGFLLRPDADTMIAEAKQITLG
jgi:hypothetical protein